MGWHAIARLLKLSGECMKEIMERASRSHLRHGEERPAFFTRTRLAAEDPSDQDFFARVH